MQAAVKVLDFETAAGFADDNALCAPMAGVPGDAGAFAEIGGVGHFVAVLAAEGDVLTIADPLSGEERMPMKDFLRRYQFSGFTMVIRPK